ncbi:MAG TPA: hypothetical protein VGJ92_01050 [Methanocella sp.]
MKDVINHARFPGSGWLFRLLRRVLRQRGKSKKDSDLPAGKQAMIEKARNEGMASAATMPYRLIR